MGEALSGAVRSASLLASRYTLIVTNPPFLGKAKQSNELRAIYENASIPGGGADLATSFVQSMISRVESSGAVCFVLPDTWRFIPSYHAYRNNFLEHYSPAIVLGLGPRAFRAQLYDYPIGLLIAEVDSLRTGRKHFLKGNVAADPFALSDFILTPLHRTKLSASSLGADGVNETLLSAYARPFEGLSTGDGDRFTRKFWEQYLGAKWEYLQMRPTRTRLWAGTEEVFLWEDGRGELAKSSGARVQGLAAWGQSGVLVERQRSLRVTLYTGQAFFKTSVVIVPSNPADCAAVWAFCKSDEYRMSVRSIDPRVGIATSAIVNVPFDVEFWRGVAAAAGPLPEP
ncbi:Eco57I restriction-modification methylase domain-containing protein, partial [Rhodococcus sp. Leaf225]